ncbi:MAG: hypothetical protein IPN50_11405 [Sphingomonadales bacterium]|nr:hypothetical protein [Sphingomonadales bacterium]
MVADDSRSTGKAILFSDQAICSFDLTNLSMLVKAWKYRHIPAACRLALNKIASNLEGEIHELTA